MRMYCDQPMDILCLYQKGSNQYNVMFAFGHCPNILGSKGRVKNLFFKKLAFDQKGWGVSKKNQLANLIFNFSTNNEYGI